MANLDAILRVTARGDASGLNVIHRGLGQIGTSARQTRQAVDGLTAGLSSIATTIGAGALGRTLLDAGVAADSSNRRIKALAEAYGEVGAVGRVADEAARQFAMSTTGARDAVASLYGRLRPMGVSLQDIETVFMGVSKASRLMALSSHDVNAVLLQLSQALGSGRLQGDELRSIMERLPAVGQAVARVMGVSASEIKKLGSEGKITTEIMIQAAAELNKLQPPPPTSMQRFTAAVENLRTELGTQLLPLVTPFVEGLTKGLTTISNLPGPVKAAGVAFGTFAVGLIAAASAMQALSIASAAFAAVKGGPVIGLLVGGVAAGAGAIAFADALKRAKESVAGLKEEAAPMAQSVAKAKEEQESFNAAVQQSNAQYELLSRTIDATSQALQGQSRLRDAVLTADIAVNNAAKSILESKLAQARTDAEKIPILKQIQGIELENARLQKVAAEEQIAAEVRITDLKRQKAWQELRSAQAALATAEAYDQQTARLQEQVNLMKIAANSADSEFKLQQQIANEKRRANDATFQAQQTQILSRQIAAAPAQMFNPAGGARPMGYINGVPYWSQTPGFATGAYVTGPTRAVFGEAGPEYAIPERSMAAASVAYLSGARGAAVLQGAAIPSPGSSAATGAIKINIQTGPVLQQDGQDWVSMDDLDAALNATAQQIMGAMRNPATRIAMGG